MDYLLDLLLSHQSISGCHHEAELKFLVQDPRQGVPFPIKKELKSGYKISQDFEYLTLIIRYDLISTCTT